MAESRQARRSALLTRIAIWCAVVSSALFYGLLACMYFRYMPSMTVVLPLVLTSIATGVLSLFAFAFRGATGGTAQFSLRGLLVVTTLVAVGLGVAVMVLRGI